MHSYCVRTSVVFFFSVSVLFVAAICCALSVAFYKASPVVNFKDHRPVQLYVAFRGLLLGKLMVSVS